MPRTPDEIKAQMNPDDRFLAQWEEREMDRQYSNGLYCGFKYGLQLVQEGKTPADILAYANTDQERYVSHGDDYADMWQGGYTNALMWCAEQFDWDEEGNPVFRPGNQWGFDAQGNPTE